MFEVRVDVQGGWVHVKYDADVLSQHRIEEALSAAGYAPVEPAVPRQVETAPPELSDES